MVSMRDFICETLNSIVGAIDDFDRTQESSATASPPMLRSDAGGKGIEGQFFVSDHMPGPLITPIEFDLIIEVNASDSLEIDAGGQVKGGIISVVSAGVNASSRTGETESKRDTQRVKFKIPLQLPRRFPLLDPDTP